MKLTIFTFARHHYFLQTAFVYIQTSSTDEMNSNIQPTLPNEIYSNMILISAPFQAQSALKRISYTLSAIHALTLTVYRFYCAFHRFLQIVRHSINLIKAIVLSSSYWACCTNKRQLANTRRKTRQKRRKWFPTKWTIQRQTDAVPCLHEPDHRNSLQAKKIKKRTDAKSK